jgi:hypothetical protein
MESEHSAFNTHPTILKQKINVLEVRYEVLTATSIQMAVFWDAAPCIY